MNALTPKGTLTALGRAIAALPVPPMVAKMLLFAAVFRVLKPVAVVAAFLSIKSPFVHSVTADGDADKRHFAGPMQSDHAALIQAYAHWRQVRCGCRTSLVAVDRHKGGGLFEFQTPPPLRTPQSFRTRLSPI